MEEMYRKMFGDGGRHALPWVHHPLSTSMCLPIQKLQKIIAHFYIIIYFKIMFGLSVFLTYFKSKYKTNFYTSILSTASTYIPSH